MAKVRELELSGCENRDAEGKPYDLAKGFGPRATPKVYGRTGRRTFIGDEKGIIYAKDLGAGVTVGRFPADPEAEGWERP